MIHLLEETRVTPTTPLIPGLHRIVYKKLEDVPGLLRAYYSYDPVQPRLDYNDQPPDLSTTGYLQLDEDGPDLDTTESREVDVDAIESSITDAQHIPITYNEEQCKAVEVIQSAYRRFAQHKKNATEANTFARRLRWFKSYWEVSQKTDWPKRSPYRLLFIGPLPHISLCLESVRDYAYQKKRDAKKASQNSTHQELEDVMNQISESG